MHPDGPPHPLGDGGDTGVGLELRRAVPTRPVGASVAARRGGHDGAGAGEAGEEAVIAMGGKDLSQCGRRRS